MNLTNLIRVAATSLSPEAEEALNGVYGGNLVNNDSLADRAAFGLEVTLIGMGVVFGVLLLLICILQVFKIFAKVQSKPVEVATNTPSTAPVAAAVPAPAVVSSANASEEAEMVAIATAAIAAARGESDCAFNIISIKKIVK